MLDVFAIPEGDLSLRMLFYIFNPLLQAMGYTDINNVDNSQLSAALAAGFKLFNSAVLFLGSVYVLLHTVSAVARTAHEGEVLGKSWSTLWVPIRVGLGFAVLVPLSSGYSLIQVIVMFFTLQGVGLASGVYGVMVDEMTKPEDFRIIARNDSSVKFSGEIYSSLACIAGANEYMDNSGVMNTVLQKDMPRFGVSKYKTKAGYLYSFGDHGQFTKEFPLHASRLGGIINGKTKSWSYQPTTCGYIEIKLDDVVDRDKLTAFYGKESKAEVSKKIWKYYAGYVSLMDRLIIDLANLYYDTNKKKYDRAYFAKRYFKIIDNFDRKVSSLVDEVFNTNSSAASWVKFAQDQKRDGWISAGATYSRMGLITDSINEAIKISPDANGVSADRYNKESGFWAWFGLGSAESKLREIIQDEIRRADVNVDTWIRYAIINKDEFTDLNVSIKESDLKAKAEPEEADSDWFWSLMSNSILDYNQDFYKHMAPNIDTQSHDERVSFLSADNVASPVAVLHAFGEVMGTIFASLLGVFIVLGAALTNIGGNALGGTGVLLVILPMITMACIALIIFAGTLKYYVPLIPLITWLGGVVAWLASVVEAIIVAPVWAISFLSPEGEGFTGQKAEQGWLLLVSVALRPVLMIFGLFAAFAIATVVFAYLNVIFTYLFNAANQSSLGPMGVIGWFMKWAIYAIAATTLINSCYSLIHIIPDKVLRWLGGGQEALGDMGATAESRTAIAAVGATGNAAINAGKDGAKDAKKNKGGNDGDNQNPGGFNAEKDSNSSSTGNSASRPGKDS